MGDRENSQLDFILEFDKRTFRRFHHGMNGTVLLKAGKLDNK
jgi:hypothetical protein